MLADIFCISGLALITPRGALVAGKAKGLTKPVGIAGIMTFVLAGRLG